MILPAKKVGSILSQLLHPHPKEQSRHLPGNQADCDERIVHHGIYRALQRDTKSCVHTRVHAPALHTRDSQVFWGPWENVLHV